ncbi:hypothetical protein [Pseudactinotalea sp. Z1748]|uniref:hypothetical protein n=1 Tax=Pseudactinotalea sp. Z1748 TaxID=3413027 RepID=UPI003C7C35E3
MSSLPEHLGMLAKGVGQLLALPTKILMVMATGVLVVLGLLVVVFVTSGHAGTAGTVAWVSIWALLVLPVLLLAQRRRRWLTRTTEAGTTHQVILPGPSESTDLATVDLTERISEDMRGRPGQEDVQILFEAVNESRAPGSGRGAGARVTRAFSLGRLSPVGRALAAIDRAQRALLTAAGGTAGAPYLKDDLRITVASLFGTMLAIPLGALAVIVLALVLLTQ